MISIDISVIVVFCIVWILLFILKKVFFNPLTKVMKERDGRIHKDHSITEKTTEDYEKAIQEIEEKLLDAKKATQLAREKTIAETLKEKERILADVSGECRSQVKEAKKKLNTQIKSLKKDLEAKGQFFSEKLEKRIFH